MRTQKIKSIILFILLVVGTYLTSLVFSSLFDGKIFRAVIYLILLIVDGFYAAEIFYEFRYITALIKTRDQIVSFLRKLNLDDKHALILAENLTMNKTDISKWKDIPVDMRLKIQKSLDKLKKYNRQKLLTLVFSKKDQ